MGLKNTIKSFLGYEDLNTLYSYLNKDVDLQFYDIGAAYGLQPQWNKVSRAFQFTLFEPHEESRAIIEKMFLEHSNISIYPDALHSNNGEETLTITNVPTGSTLLKFDEKSEGYRYADKNYIHPTREEKLSVRRLDSVIVEKKLKLPDCIKLDTQGTEFYILDGLGETSFKDLTTIEIEIGIVETCLNQPHYSQLLMKLEEYGFFPYDFRVARNYIKKTGDTEYFKKIFDVKNEEYFVSARSWEFDVVFFKSTNYILATRDIKKIKKLFMSFLIYNFFYDAMDLLDRAAQQGVITDSEKERLFNISKRIYKSQRVMHVYTLIRNKLKNIFNIFNKNYWARFMWTQYPNS